MKILMVDDKEENRYFLESLLKGFGYEVIPAVNGKDAIKKLRGDSFNMIISDILMPEMDGFQFLKNVKADNNLSNIPFVFYTATYTSGKDKELGLKLGVDEYIVKPIDPGELIKIIKGIIRDAESGKLKPKKPATEKEEEVLKLYSERLVRKLEKKSLNLEREITKRKRVEKELQRINRALKTISECNQVLIHADDETDLLNDICGIIVKIGGYRFAWVGYAEKDKKKSIRPVAQAGYEDGYLDTLNLTWADTKRGRGPTGTAIRTEKPSICKNILTDPKYAPWRAQAVKQGYESSVALPLISGDLKFGALNIYAPEPDAFDKEEIKLLTELADDMAYGIVSLRTHTERKKAEEELQQHIDENTKLAVIAKERGELQDWINTFDTFVGKYDPNGVGIIFNEAPIKAGGVTIDEVVGKYFPDTKWWSHSEIERAAIVECFEQAKAGLSSRIETNFRSADGTPVPIIFNCQPVMDDDGKVKYITAEGKTIIEETRLRTELNEAKDALETRVRERTSELIEANVELKKEIAERKQAEEALRESYYIINRSPAVIFLWKNAEGWPVEYVSNNVKDVFGYTAEEFMSGKVSYTSVIHSDDMETVGEGVSTYSKDKRRNEFTQEYRIVTKDTKIKWIDDRTFIRRNEKGEITHYQGIALDITERKQAEEELQKYRQQLEQLIEARTAELQAANKELEAFAYSVSHDLRAPLRAIDGFTNILMEDYASKLDAEGKRLGTVIHDNTRKMGQLIDDLLAFSRLGRAAMHFSEIDMQNMAYAIYHEATTAEERKRITFTLTDLPKAVGDPTMMRQVWMNLISNAIKFSANRKQAVISVTCREDEKKINYCIQDNGAGFDMKYKDKLFGVFHRLHSEREFEGTGVGLSLVQRIIHRHGGEVWAEGEVDKGAAFYFSLPKTDK